MTEKTLLEVKKFYKEYKAMDCHSVMISGEWHDIRIINGKPETEVPTGNVTAKKFQKISDVMGFVEYLETYCAR